MSKWDLSVFYPSLDAWDEDVKVLPTHIEKLASYKGNSSIPFQNSSIPIF